MLCTGPVIVISRVSLGPMPPLPSSEVTRYVGSWFDGVVSCGVFIPPHEVLRVCTVAYGPENVDNSVFTV